MKWKELLSLFCLLLLLSSCSYLSQEASHKVAKSAKENIAIIVRQNPDCKNVGDACNAQIDAIVSACDAQTQKIDAERVKWKWAFLGLFFSVILYIVKKVVK